jgi:hypothetical protein
MQLARACVALLFISSAAAESFLGHTGTDMVSLAARSEELQAALGAVMGCTGEVSVGDHESRTSDILKYLLPIWNSVPKNSHNRVQWKLLRYMAHRYFMQRFSVLVRGLEPSIKVNDTNAGEAEFLNLEAPGLAQQLEGPRVHGFSLEDASAMIVSLEQLLFDADSGLMEKMFTQNHFPPNRHVSQSELNIVLRDYMVYWMLGDDDEGAGILIKDDILLRKTIPHWSDILQMLEGSVSALIYSRQQRLKPKTVHTAFYNRLTFEDALEVAGSISRGFGAFWEPQCQDTKNSLLELDKTRTGRVRLTHFYGSNKGSDWRFAESEAYLRELGALDETSSWRGNQVIVPNYIQAASNCIVTRDHYLVCCRVECEDIMAFLEQSVKSPVSSPEQVLLLVSHVTDGDDNAANVDRSLQEQLQSIANMHGGQVPLHGRLFAQWLHYVFPRECAFPHVSGAVSSLTPMQFGDSCVVSEEDMGKHIAEDVIKRDLAPPVGNITEQWMTQWIEEEELLGDYSKHLTGPSWDGKPLLLAVAAATTMFGFFWAGSKQRAGPQPAASTVLV